MLTKETFATLIFATSFGAFACGGVEGPDGLELDPLAEESSDSPITVVGGGDAAISAGQTAITAYGIRATQNSALACTSATAYYGYITVLGVSTGESFAVFGAGASGPVTVEDQSGTGSLALAAGATWNVTEGTANLSAGILGHYRLDAGSTMPSDVAQANALFDASFGPSSRHGISLDHVVTAGYRTPKTVAYYGTGTFIITLPNGAQVPASLAVGIALREGRVLAIHTSGTSGMTSFVR